jgi:hypothetical protein
MRITLLLTLGLVAVTIGYLPAQSTDLDSMHIYSLNQQGEAQLMGRAVYEYLDDGRTQRSEYFLFSERTRQWRQINIQVVRFNEAGLVAERVTTDFMRSLLDSTVYTYVQGNLLHSEHKYQSAWTFPPQYRLQKTIAYDGFDPTGRKTTVTTTRQGRAGAETTLEKYTYVYNEDSLLVDRTICRETAGGDCQPHERLLQGYDQQERIQTVQQQSYLGPEEGFQTRQLYQYAYEGNRRIATKTILQPSTGSLQYHAMSIIDYRTEQRKEKEQELTYVLEADGLQLLKREVYFFRE